VGASCVAEDHLDTDSKTGLDADCKRMDLVELGDNQESEDSVATRMDEGKSNLDDSSRPTPEG
jgi:hypothetical protein